MSTNNDLYRWIADSIVYRWFGLLIACFGFIGGTLSLLVFRRKSLRKKSCSIYFFSLALADLLCMIGWLVQFVLPTFNLQLNVLSNISCKLFVFSLYFAFDLANYILTVCSIDRAVSVLFPIESRRFCHTKMAYSITILLVIVLTLVNSHIFYGFVVLSVKSSRNDRNVLICHHQSNSSFYQKLFSIYDSYVDVIKTNVIPFVLMSICNLIIINRVCRSKFVNVNHRRENLSLNANRTKKSKRKQEKDRQLTLMLLGSSIAFLVLTLPTEINDIIRSHSSRNQVDEKEYLLSSILLSLAHFNYAVHFYIYTLTGEVFRRELFNLWPIEIIRRHFRLCLNKQNNRKRNATNLKNKIQIQPRSNSNENIFEDRTKIADLSLVTTRIIDDDHQD